MPLIKNPQAIVSPTPAASAPAGATAVSESPKKTGLKRKDSIPTELEAAVESVAKAAAQITVAATLQPKDMEPKERRIQRSGIWQAVVQSNALVQYAPTLEAFLNLVDQAADRGLMYVNRP